MKALFVGEIGGRFEAEPKSFHPIQDFQGKSVEQIQADLKSWFSEKDQLSDFNVFFKQSAAIAQKRNLTMSPITVVMLSDGIPALPGGENEAKIGRYEEIRLKALCKALLAAFIAGASSMSLAQTAAGAAYPGVRRRAA